MNANLIKAGKQVFKLLERNSEALMHAYAKGSLDESQLSAKQRDSLLSFGLIWRPQHDAPLMLSAHLRGLLEEAMSDLRNRQIDANAASRLATIKTLASHYKEARHHQRYHEADAYLQDLSQHCYQLTESLRHATRTLWSRINNEFGYVASLSAKIRENQLAQQQVSELLDNLGMLSFEVLTQQAGDLRELRQLLVQHLASSVEDCASELAVVQVRLLQLLGRFRQLRGNTRLLKGFSLHCQQQPDYAPKDATAQVSVPALFNQATALIKPANLDIYNQAHEHALLEIASKLKRRTQSLPVSEDTQTLNLAEDSLYSLQESGIKHAVEDYFVAVFDSEFELSALGYHHQQALDYGREAWLYQVWSRYHSLDDEQRQYFSLEVDGSDYGEFSGNKLVHDLRLGLR